MSVFIENQFPIARLSAEAYKERKANNGQTLTRLGKWWGRKPLILVRAAILGMLMPASDNPKKDREIFLKILTMDDDGVWLRCKGEIPAVAWREAANSDVQEEYFGARGFKRGLSDEEKEEICALIWDSLGDVDRNELDNQRRRPIPSREEFDALPYAERIRHCERPENIVGPKVETWSEINAHLGTTASSLPGLVRELGVRQFGHPPRVGDCFCGGGSIPFEAARIGCEAFGYDLNPVAALLTWADLNLLGGGREMQEKVMRVQAKVLREADKQITDWGIEHNDQGERADAYLYCVEVKPEGCDYYIPLAPSWLIGEKSKVVVTWRRVPGSDRLQPEIQYVSSAELKAYKDGKGATIVSSRVVDPFDSNRSWSLEALRGPEGLRRWTNEDLAPRPDDVFQERLYCIRWVQETEDEITGRTKEVRRYAAPDHTDLEREAKVLILLRERFAQWQRKGFIPSKAISSGYNTEQPIRERGWSYWHHFYTPRQLLTHGLVAEISSRIASSQEMHVACLLGLGRIADWDSRSCAWMWHGSNEKGNQTFTNQALNTLVSYAGRALSKLAPTFQLLDGAHPISFGNVGKVSVTDARDINSPCELWVTDPPYADAINYHELGDFFLAWYDTQMARVFPNWVPDARAELAVRGDGEDFRRSMVDIYRNLARCMPDNGLQLVMFTHKNPGVWANLGMILWAAGLTATAAWTISTETDAVGLKKGDYVQGTVCLVLRKRLESEPGFMDEVSPLVEDEVQNQIAFMQSLDEAGEPNFNDADYQLAAYAAALKVLTRYSTLDGRDVEHEVFAQRDRNEKSDFQKVIERALEIACSILVPRGLHGVWRDLSLVERYYMRALDIESRGERRKGMYEELARGFGVADIRPLLKTDKANGTRMHTASGLGASLLAVANEGNAQTLPSRRGRAATGAPHPFAFSPLRHLLFAMRETTRADLNPESGRQYLRDTYGQSYWSKRELFLGLLEWLSTLANSQGMDEWTPDSESARILAGRLRNDEA
ncbi:anti-phage-associated DUF1156 domain-containing protein [Fundidesulfovibrio soli]|uniref:anti-phage-associated DUF1156 domain-containing protein n=1 Tax=Fundidesulfovibrio soli TaxID=2922716 RepID=UPI001FB03D87|nr:anti-phage-associated DUF1156 domain-containing protein [Fundidesulfovibrio soli]